MSGTPPGDAPGCCLLQPGLVVVVMAPRALAWFESVLSSWSLPTPQVSLRFLHAWHPCPSSQDAHSEYPQPGFLGPWPFHSSVHTYRTLSPWAGGGGCVIL